MLDREREAHERTLNGIRRLEARLSFRFAVLQRLLDRQIGRILSGHGVSLAAYRILLTIDVFEEMSAAELVRMVAVDKATVSRTCAELVRTGLLEARADPRSARRKLLRLSEAGAARLAAMQPDVEARNAGLDALFTEEERRALETALARLTRHTAGWLEADGALDTAAVDRG